MAKKTAPTSDRNTVTLTEAQKAELAEAEKACDAVRLQIVAETEKRLKAEENTQALFQRFYALRGEANTKLANIALLSGIDITKPDHGWDYKDGQFVREPKSAS